MTGETDNEMLPEDIPRREISIFEFQRVVNEVLNFEDHDHLNMFEGVSLHLRPSKEGSRITLECAVIGKVDEETVDYAPVLAGYPSFATLKTDVRHLELVFDSVLKMFPKNLPLILFRECFKRHLLEEPGVLGAMSGDDDFAITVTVDREELELAMEWYVGVEATEEIRHVSAYTISMPRELEDV